MPMPNVFNFIFVCHKRSTIVNVKRNPDKIENIQHSLSKKPVLLSNKNVIKYFYSNSFQKKSHFKSNISPLSDVLVVFFETFFFRSHMVRQNLHNFIISFSFYICCPFSYYGKSSSDVVSAIWQSYLFGIIQRQPPKFEEKWPSLIYIYTRSHFNRWSQRERQRLHKADSINISKRYLYLKNMTGD